MRLTLPLLILVLFAGLPGGCSKEDIAHESAYQQSFKAWQTFKKASDNSYRFMVKSGSWNGYGSETTFTIEKGVVTGRHHKSTIMDGGTGAVTVRNEWTEDASTLNTHDGALEPMTLDDVYHQAKTDLLTKRSKTTPYFEAKNDGLISTVGYTMEECVDDCFVGLRIVSITKL
ncbi:hypothetical protein MKQ68_12120 [Chitinophaga horti]|uniref:Lipoprotein n=1 Tax=Chitinophaga horti TaxID=2920382 RepID=A0ABY6J8B9_9BACT|nr:hypothetical protein [Chitinophaga horti]UYQ95847.1 hypothetical protein MKQ68_12120 [Chitinophaga horti]